MGEQLASAPWPRGKVREDLELAGHPFARVLSVGAKQVPHDVVVGVADFDQLWPMNPCFKNGTRGGVEAKNNWSWTGA